MRSRNVALLLGLAATGCFNPGSVDQETDGTSGGSSGGSTPLTTGSEASSSSTAATTATTTATTTGTAGPETGEPSDTSESVGVDEPPEITLSVSGEERPATQTESDRIPLLATVTDDNSIDRVEFFRDEELIATVESPPYSTEVLLTSIDNATVSFSAIAYDDAEQSTQSEVALEVAIDGGTVIHTAAAGIPAGSLRREATPGGGVAVAQDGSVVVTTSPVVDGTTTAIVTRLSPDLSEPEWMLSIPSEEAGVDYGMVVTGEPVLLEDEDRVVQAVTSFNPFLSGWGSAVLSVPLDGSAVTIEHETAVGTTTINSPGLAIGAEGDIVLHGPSDTLRRVSNAGTVWLTTGVPSDEGLEGARHMSSDGQGNILLESLACAKTCTWTVGQYQADDGMLAWEGSIPSGDATVDWRVGASITAPNGDVILVASNGEYDGRLSVARWNSGGDQLEGFFVDFGDSSLRTVADIEIDEQGRLVLVGSLADGVNSAEANMVRLAQDGTVDWERDLGLVAAREWGLGFDLDDRGRAVVAVLSNVSVTITWDADLWVRTVSL